MINNCAYGIAHRTSGNHSLFSIRLLKKKPLKTCVLKGSRVLCFDKSREEGIRTLDTVARIPTFQAGSFDHSDTSLNGECKSNVFS